MQTTKSGGSYPDPGQWSTGLFDCSEDWSTCLKTCCCPCYTMGEIIEIIDRGATSRQMACGIFFALHSVFCSWLYTSNYRSKLRALFDLPEVPYADTVLHCCCCVCAISQEYRELKNRGIDPSLGWEGNAEKLKQAGVVVPPLFPSGMTR